MSCNFCLWPCLTGCHKLAVCPYVLYCRVPNCAFAGIFGSFFRLLLGWADIPDSFCEVALSFVLLVVTHSSLRVLAGLAAEQLRDSGQLAPAVEKAVDSDGPDGTRYVFFA